MGVRGVTTEDSKLRLAELLYQVDDFIYPDFVPGNKKKSIEVLSHLIGNCNFYELEDIKVFELDNKLIGIFAQFKPPIKASKSEFEIAYKKANVEIPPTFDLIFDKYYKAYEEYDEGIVLTSLAIDEKYRGKGYGYKLFHGCLDDKQTYYLDTIKDNEKAVNLYKKCGFVPIKEKWEYGALCFIMKRSPLKNNR